MRRVLIALLLVLGSCNFAVKHPAITTGLVAGTLGLGTCELASSDHEQCFLISGGAGLGLALITAGAIWLGEMTAADDPEIAPPGEDPTNLEPAPIEIPTPPDPGPTTPTPLPTPEPTPPPAPPVTPGAGSGSASPATPPP